MKTNELNEKVDKAIMYILLFVPFLILCMVTWIEKIVNIITKKK